MLDRNKKDERSWKESSLGTDLGTKKANVERVNNDLFHIELILGVSQGIHYISFYLYVKYGIDSKLF